MKIIRIGTNKQRIGLLHSMGYEEKSKMSGRVFIWILRLLQQIGNLGELALNRQDDERELLPAS
jgi:hypothetical protein